jgi:hypothetical protein
VKPLEVATLDGTGSSDPDPGDSIASYSWKAPAGVTLSDPTSAKPTFVYPSDEPIPDSLTFSLTVTDTHGATSAQPATVTVGVNHSPIPDVVVLPSKTVEPGTSVTMDASGSKDPDPGDSIISFTWSQKGGPSVQLSSTSGPVVQFTAPSVDKDTALNFTIGMPDTYAETTTTPIDIIIKSPLCVLSETQQSKTGSVSTSQSLRPSIKMASETVSTASAGNCRPEAIAGPDQTINERLDVRSRTTVELNGRGFDANGDTLTYLWTPASPGAPALSNPTIANPTFNVPDIEEDTSYSYTLTVNDGKENSLPDPITIHVTATRISIELDQTEITPEIAGLTFGNLVTFPGQGLVDTVQSRSEGGEAAVSLKLEGITNAQNVRVQLDFDPLVDTGGHDHLDAVDNNVKRAFGGFMDTQGRVSTQQNVRMDANGEFETTYKAENLGAESSSWVYRHHSYN